MNLTVAPLTTCRLTLLLRWRAPVRNTPSGTRTRPPPACKAIDAAAQAGGGRVRVPEGVFLTGALHLKSNVNLHVVKGATVKFIPDPKLYPIVLTRFEGLECMNYSPFVYAL